MLRRSAMIGVLALCSMVPLQAFAWDGTISGTVGTIELDPGGGFNVSLSNAPNLCSGKVPGWYGSHALVGLGGPAGSPATTGDGVRNLLSVLTAAKLSGKTVVFFTTVTNNMCYLGAVDLP